MYESPDDLVRRSKDLDLREALLNDKERRLDEKEATAQVEVLNKQITATRKILDDLNAQSIEVGEEYKKKIDGQNRALHDLTITTERKEAFITKLDSQKGQIDSDISHARSTLEDTNRQIRDRKLYLDEQEETINQTIEGWNSHLTELKSQAAKLNQDKTRSVEQFALLENEKETLSNEIGELQDKQLKLDGGYEERAEQYRSKLRDYDAQINTKQNLLNTLEAQQVIRERDLSTREQSVKVREIVLSKNERELQQKERKLKMDYNLAGQAYD